MLRRVTSGAFKYNSANSRALLSALPFTAQLRQPLPIHARYAPVSGCGFSRKASAPSRSSAVTPGGKDAVAGRNARREVGHILESRTLARHNDTGK